MLRLDLVLLSVLWLSWAYPTRARVFYMQNLSIDGKMYSIAKQRFGRILSHIGSTYAVMRESLIRIVAPDKAMRIRLRFEGPVRLSRHGGRREPNSCIPGTHDWMDVYEMYNSTSQLRIILPRICGNWLNGTNRISVLPDIYSSTSEIYIRFKSTSRKKKPGTGFIIDFLTIYPNTENVPIYLMNACKPGRALQIRERRSKSSTAVQVAQHLPLFRHAIIPNVLRSLNCTIELTGLTGREEFGLVFTWFQLPDQPKYCGSRPPYLKVFATEKNTLTYTSQLTTCGERKPFMLLTNSSRLRIVIKGNMGYGVAFNIYTSYAYVKDKYGEFEKIVKKSDVEGAFSSGPIVVGITIIFCVGCCYMKKKRRIQNRSGGYTCAEVCAFVGVVAESVAMCVGDLFSCLTPSQRNESTGRRTEVPVIETSYSHPPLTPSSTLPLVRDAQTAPPVYDSLQTPSSVYVEDVIPQELSPLYESLAMERLPTPSSQLNTVPNYSEMPPSYDEAVTMPNYNLPTRTNPHDDTIGSQPS